MLHGAFMPKPEDNQTSVFRTSGIDETGILSIAKDQILHGLRVGQRIHGRGDITAFEICIQTLKVKPEISSHPLHANIHGWPFDKEHQLILAGELAMKAKLRLFEIPLTRR